MTFHEDYVRTKVNEAIKTGLNSQKVNRTKSGKLALKLRSQGTTDWKTLSPARLLILLAIVAIAITFFGG